MAPEQTILFTVLPRGIAVDADRLPVSVYVAPRLTGGDYLGVFDDWLKWTHKLKQNGLNLTFQCGAKHKTLPIDRQPLRPDLWEQLFHEDTLVRSHTFDDYTDRPILSYSMRQALSALKAIYQEASLSLALPDQPGQLGKERQTNRSRLHDLIEGMEVNWNGREAKSWREAVRIRKGSKNSIALQQALSGPLDQEGLIIAQPDATAKKRIAVPFAVFHHMPTPSYKDHPIADDLDTENLLDFHQALSALNSYPELMRALGLVFDLELPREFVTETGPNPFGTLSIDQVKPGWSWSLVTHTTPLATAYIHQQLGQHRFFLTAPRFLSGQESPITILGLLNLDPNQFGLAQVDVDGGMHKTIMLAETFNPPPGHNLDPDARPGPAPHPEVFDPGATLPALRSGGFSLFADRRALQLLDTLLQGKAFNDALVNNGQQARPFFAEDLARGYRIDIWDSRTQDWHSLHLRNGAYQVGDLAYTPDVEPEEGFIQSAATQPAPGAEPETDDLYLHEAIARWAGWSLSAPMPSKHLSRYPNPKDAVPRDDEPDKFAEDQPDTPFKLTGRFKVAPNSLPRLSFGVRYRLRARAVDLAGNGLKVDDPLADLLAGSFALPLDPGGFTYLRYEPVAAPLVVLRDPAGVTTPGSAVDRLVIRTFNADPSQDTVLADTSAADRHILPPRTTVEMGERLGMFDDASGKLKSDPTTWQLISKRDAGELHSASIKIAGKTDDYPLEPSDRIDELPYLPDPLSGGAALRDLPGTPSETTGSAAPGAGPADSVKYIQLSDPNPRPGSATLISFNGETDWQKMVGFRLVLSEPQPGQTDMRPSWDPVNRALTVYLPKGQVAVTPLSSHLSVEDLKLMGIWQWLRQYIELVTIFQPRPQYLQPGTAVDQIAHILQRAVEGGHWMLTPPRLLTLVHAVQQPVGRPRFQPLDVEYQSRYEGSNPLQTAPDRGRKDPAELAAVTAWRRPGETDAYLLGALAVHAASTGKIDLQADWQDPVDDLSQKTWTLTNQSVHVDELRLPTLSEGYLTASGKDGRQNGYYDPEHDQVAFVRSGDWTGTPGGKMLTFHDAAPRHLFNDTRRHVVRYTAVATTRFQEYFPTDQAGGFTRSSDPLVVDVPASARPLAPDVAYVLPTFGWERQTETNLKRSVRFGGGLRVYLQRPWFSSGEGELLGVALWNPSNGILDAAQRDKYKAFFTQWGMDPIWQTGDLSGAPDIHNFPDAFALDQRVSLEESTAHMNGQPGRVDVVGFEPQFDESRGLWFADLTINTFSETYMPFIRLALVRYQPHALADARISRVVLANFAQLTPDRSAMVTADPYHPQVLRVTVSGVSPRGPQPVEHGEPKPAVIPARPTQIQVRVQKRTPAIQSDLGWQDVGTDVAVVQPNWDGPVVGQPDLALWTGAVIFTKPVKADEFRLVITEHEFVSADYSLVTPSRGKLARQKATAPSRIIYSEIFPLDSALIQA